MSNRKKIRPGEIYPIPMTHEEFRDTGYLVLKYPSLFHLIDILRHVAIGRPDDTRLLIESWIQDLEQNLELGEPMLERVRKAEESRES
ncbi:MAG: hypothetical protein AAFQ94_09300 [Bacteroidota bacterium]